MEDNEGMTVIKRALGAEYERAQKSALARMKKGYNLGFIKPQSRDELHDRAKLRVESEQGRGSGSGEKASGDYLAES
jgi:hypothetical protein